MSAETRPLESAYSRRSCVGFTRSNPEMLRGFFFFPKAASSGASALTRPQTRGGRLLLNIRKHAGEVKRHGQLRRSFHVPRLCFSGVLFYASPQRAALRAEAERNGA